MTPLSTLTHFQKTYGKPELQVHVPGRVNIIGEHTDYSGGDVLPFAIDQYMSFLGKQSSHPFTRITSLDFVESIELTKKGNFPLTHWSRYFFSTIETLHNHGYNTRPMDISFTSNIPVGAGISSSSALTCGFLKIISALCALSLSNEEIIKLASISENGTGVMGGIMDQSAIVQGVKDKAILLNCQNRTITYVPSEIPNHDWLLINSGVQHNLVLTDYNNRSLESKKALQLIQSTFPAINSLRDITKTHLDFLRMKNSLLARRARHFFHEQKRVSRMVKALHNKDDKSIGRLLYECHTSLKDLYEVSCDEIDWIVASLKDIKSVKGARIMGGGFGGSVICLIEKNSESEIMDQISPLYFKRFNKELSSFITYASDGLKIVS